MADDKASEGIKQETTDQLWRAVLGHGQAWSHGA